MPKGYRKDGTPFGFKKGNQLGKLLKGIKRSPETRKRIALSKIGNKNGVGNKNALGKHWRLSEETRNKHRGAANFNWRGGIYPINLRIRKSLEYRLWRESVFKRDNYTCIWCGKVGGKLHADHIKSFSEYPELRFAIDNGRTLCFECHKKTDNYGRKNKTSL